MSHIISRARPRLYLITPPQIDPPHFAAVLDEALAAGDVACLQLRLKDKDGQAVDDTAIAQAIAAIAPITQARGVTLLLNDRPDLAAKFACDGVHIGQQDMPYKKARAILGADKIIGVTCHNSRHLAMLAGEAGADYVAFGAFYATPTKQTKTTATPDLLHWWQQLMQLPCVAIGGITPHNAAPLLVAGADFIAACASVWQHPKSAAMAVQTFNALFDETYKNFPPT